MQNLELEEIIKVWVAFGGPSAKAASEQQQTRRGSVLSVQDYFKTALS